MPLKKKRRQQGASIRLSKAELEKRDMWEDRVELLANEIGQAENLENPRANDKPLSVLKRGIYQLVNELNGDRRHSSLEAALVYIINKPLRVRFEDNPYHWGLAAVSASGETGIDFHDSISQYGRELLYARRHRIPEELLIGFIYQVGGAKRIRERLDREPFEDWFHAELSWS